MLKNQIQSIHTTASHHLQGPMNLFFDGFRFKMFDLITAPGHNRPAPATSHRLAGPVQVCCSSECLWELNQLKLNETYSHFGAVVSASFCMPCGFSSNPTTAGISWTGHSWEAGWSRHEWDSGLITHWTSNMALTRRRKKFSHENDDSEKKLLVAGSGGP